MPYETITVSAESRVRSKSTVTGFAGVTLHLSPIPDQEIRLNTEVELPESFIEACLEGIRERLEAGILRGHPIRGIEVTLSNAEQHPTDSTEEAFRLAGFHGFHSAFQKAEPIVVED